MTTRTLLLVGTPKGAFVLESDAARDLWSLRGPMCEGWPIHDVIVDPASGALLAAGGSPWYGPAVFRSTDLGATWTHSSVGLTYGDDGEAIKTTWSLAAGPGGTIYAGVEPAGLFRSADGGVTWSHVQGLTDHPTRSGWQPGNGGLILHTIVPHPTDADRVWVGISAVGVFETRDGGITWVPRNAGVRADFNPDPHPETGQCVHKFAAAAGQPETLYQQNHCGVYRSDDGGEHWDEMTPGLPGQFGFPLVTDPRDPDTAWVIPLNGDDKGRYMPDASAAVWRTHDRGASWIRAGDGLPQEGAYLSVLREAMARDTLDPVGVAFGTGTGQLWHSADAGVSWNLVTRDLPAIWSVESVVLDGWSERLATVLLPRSLLALFPGVERRHEVAAGTVGAVIDALDATVPGLRDRLVQAGPRLRPHINVFVDGEPGDLATEVADTSVVHVIPAVSGGA